MVVLLMRIIRKNGYFGINHSISCGTLLAKVTKTWDKVYFYLKKLIDTSQCHKNKWAGLPNSITSQKFSESIIQVCF